MPRPAQTKGRRRRGREIADPRSPRPTIGVDPSVVAAREDHPGLDIRLDAREAATPNRDPNQREAKRGDFHDPLPSATDAETPRDISNEATMDVARIPTMTASETAIGTL